MKIIKNKHLLLNKYNYIYALLCCTIAHYSIATNRDVPSSYATIQAAFNAANDGDIIVLDYTHSPFTGSGNNTISWPNKTPAVNTLTIQSSSTDPANKAVIDLSHNQFINVPAGKRLILQNLTILNGLNVSAISNNGTLTIDNCTFNNNFATGNGAAIYNAGSLTIINNCFFIINNTGGDGGAIYNDTTGTLSIDSCTFSNNSASNGGAIYNNNGTLTIENNCSFSSNSASNDGGAIYNDTTGTLSIDSCTFSNNSASNGGAIYNNNGTLTIENNCSFSSNSASNDGGAIYNDTTGTPDH